MAEHRVGLVQRVRRDAASSPRSLPVALRQLVASPRRSCGRNSCSGGSSRRMVTGRPSMIAEDADEVARAASAAAWRARVAPAFGVVGQDHLAHGDDAVGVEEHVLGAAEADALGAEARAPCARRAACRRWCAPSCVRTSSAQPISVAKSPESSGWMVGTAPSMTSPVEPSRVMMSPALTTCSRTVMRLRLRSRCADRRRRRRRRGPCRARRPRRGWSCRRASVRMPSRGVHAVDVLGAGLDAHQDHRLALGRRAPRPRRR